ncbi:hypothetical protein AAF712_016257, partial [Marasmius tenuissimus]
MHLKHFALLTSILPVVLAGVIPRSNLNPSGHDTTEAIPRKEDVASRQVGVEGNVAASVAANAGLDMANAAAGAGLDMAGGAAGGALNLAGNIFG